MNFSGKTAVVTGGSRGLGRAVCRKLAEGGANVVFSYAGNTAAAQETVKELESMNGSFRATTSTSSRVRAARKTRRPMRPKPLIPI